MIILPHLIEEPVIWENKYKINQKSSLFDPGIALQQHFHFLPDEATEYL